MTVLFKEKKNVLPLSSIVVTARYTSLSDHKLFLRNILLYCEGDELIKHYFCKRDKQAKNSISLKILFPTVILGTKILIL